MRVGYLKSTWRFPNNCKYALKCSKGKGWESIAWWGRLFTSQERWGNFLPFISLYTISRAPLLKSSARELLKAYIWIINTLMIPTRAQRAMPEAKFFRCTLFLGTQTSFPLSSLFHFAPPLYFCSPLTVCMEDADWFMLSSSLL